MYFNGSMSSLRKRQQLLLQRERRSIDYWRSSATMVGVNAALIPFPEIRAKQLAIADAYDELAAIGEDLYARYHEPRRNFEAVANIADPAPARLRILKTAVPALRRVAMLWSADSLNMPWRYQPSLATADELGITVKLLGVSKIDRFNGAFAAIEQEMPDGLVMAADTLGNLNRRQMYSFASKYKLPTIYESVTFARQGGLMSYGPDAVASASLRDPTRPPPLRLVLNLNTAYSINLTIPSDLIAQADEVIA